MAAAIIFELFIMGVIFMVFEDAKADGEVKIKIQDGDSKKFKDIIMDVVFMVFVGNEDDSEVKIKIQDGGCDHFRIVHHGSRFHGFRGC